MVCEAGMVNTRPLEERVLVDLHLGQEGGEGGGDGGHLDSLPVLGARTAGVLALRGARVPGLLRLHHHGDDPDLGPGHLVTGVTIVTGVTLCYCYRDDPLGWPPCGRLTVPLLTVCHTWPDQLTPRPGAGESLARATDSWSSGAAQSLLPLPEEGVEQVQSLGVGGAAQQVPGLAQDPRPLLGQP